MRPWQNILWSPQKVPENRSFYLTRHCKRKTEKRISSFTVHCKHETLYNLLQCGVWVSRTVNINNRGNEVCCLQDCVYFSWIDIYKGTDIMDGF